METTIKRNKRIGNRPNIPALVFLHNKQKLVFPLPIRSPQMHGIQMKDRESWLHAECFNNAVCVCHYRVMINDEMCSRSNRQYCLVSI